jgi:ADP-glucose pyrophosphorylase
MPFYRCMSSLSYHGRARIWTVQSITAFFAPNMVLIYHRHETHLYNKNLSQAIYSYNP